MNKRRCGVGVAVLNDLLYAVGGHDGQSYLNSIERFVMVSCALLSWCLWNAAEDSHIGMLYNGMQYFMWTFNVIHGICSHLRMFSV